MNKFYLTMSAPRSIELDEMFPGLDVFLERFLCKDVQPVVDHGSLGFGGGLLKDEEKWLTQISISLFVKWNVTPLIFEGGGRYFFAAFYCSLL